MSLFVTKNGNRLVVGTGLSLRKMEKTLATTKAYDTIIMFMQLEEIRCFEELVSRSVSKDTKTMKLNKIEGFRAQADWIVDRLGPDTTGKLYVAVKDILANTYWRGSAIPRAKGIAPKLGIYML